VLNDVLCDNRRDFHILGANKRQFFFGGLYLLANGIACPCRLLLIFLFYCLTQDAKWGGVICAERRRWLDVAQFGECNSEWGATLGVVKARSNF
jgi:hypothetical protein